MMELLDYFFGIAQFVPHGMCLLWRPDLLLMHGTADLLIAAAYFTIPIVIMKAARNRPDLIDKKVAFLFATFITACALTHLTALVTLWVPFYGIQGLIKLATAGVSIYTAYQLALLLPSLLSMPSRDQLANAIAQREIEHAIAEEVQHKNEELDQFAYITSHDLKEPLRGVTINATFLREEDLPPTAIKRLDRIMELCAKMERLITDLLNLSRLNSDQKGLESVDMVTLAEEIRGDLSEALDERGARLIVQGPMPIAVADKAKLRTVLGNLFSNAIKYNTSDNPTITFGFAGDVTVADTALKNAYFVRDNGIGIEERHRNKVFQLFTRLHSEKAYGPGTGAGLAFVQRIIKTYGGKIRLLSEPGTGSTFYFTLPCEPPSEEPHTEPVEVLA